MDIVQEVNGSALASSRVIAEMFGKSHKHVLESARKLIRDLDSHGRDFGRENFTESDYQTARGKTYQNIMMSRDGFTILAFGFSGPRALEWKIKYLEAFNKMEAYIRRDDSSISASSSINDKINSVSLEVERIAEAGSSWGKTGSAIRKAKRAAIDDLNELIDKAQLRLGF